MLPDLDRPVDRRQSDSNKWNRYPADVLPLWVADMDFPSPEPVVRALRERVEHGFFGYAAEPPALAEAVCARLERLYAWKVAPEALLFVPGVIAGFNVAVRALAGPGDGIVLQTPVYPPILRVPANVGLALRAAPLARDAAGRYQADLDTFAAALATRPRVFLLCNPHNPVGRVYAGEELARMAEACLAHDVAIVSDEIHGDLVYRGQRHTPIATLDPAVAARTITFIAPSKTWNLPGLKVAVAIIPDPDLRARFEAARADLVRTVNTFGLVGALAAWRDGQPWLDHVLAYLEANRDFVARFVAAELGGVRMVSPEATYLAWLDCSRTAAAGDPFTFFLERAKVALNDGRTFGPGGEGFVRLNFACPRRTLTDALGRMREALRRG